MDAPPPSAAVTDVPAAAATSSSSGAAEDLERGVAAMSLEERFATLRSIGEECIQDEEELLLLLQNKPVPVCYDGFEPSGRMHFAQGVVKTIYVNKMVKAGCKVKIWIADWFAQLNNKMGGDLKKIQTVGRYMIEIWKAAGMNLDGVEFLWSSEEINKRAGEYWPLVMDIATKNNVKRITRCYQIMGRSYEAGNAERGRVPRPGNFVPKRGTGTTRYVDPNATGTLILRTGDTQMDRSVEKQMDPYLCRLPSFWSLSPSIAPDAALPLAVAGLGFAASRARRRVALLPGSPRH